MLQYVSSEHLQPDFLAVASSAQSLESMKHQENPGTSPQCCSSVLKSPASMPLLPTVQKLSVFIVWIPSRTLSCTSLGADGELLLHYPGRRRRQNFFFKLKYSSIETYFRTFICFSSCPMFPHLLSQFINIWASPRLHTRPVPWEPKASGVLSVGFPPGCWVCPWCHSCGLSPGRPSFWFLEVLNLWPPGKHTWRSYYLFPGGSRNEIRERKGFENEDGWTMLLRICPSFKHLLVAGFPKVLHEDFWIFWGCITPTWRYLSALFYLYSLPTPQTAINKDIRTICSQIFTS